MKNKKDILITRGSTFFLKGAVVAVGLVVLALCVFALPASWLAVPEEYPDATYAFYLILIAMYAAAIPFYIALYQALLLLRYVDKNQAFSELSVGALKRIAYCGLAISGVYGVSLPLFYVWAQEDDAPGLVIIGMVLTVAPLVISVFAAVMQRLLREAIRMKSENDLTV